MPTGLAGTVVIAITNISETTNMNTYSQVLKLSVRLLRVSGRLLASYTTAMREKPTEGKWTACILSSRD